MKKLDKLLAKPWAAYTFAICSAVALYMILSNIPEIVSRVRSMLNFLSPVITGIIVAYLFNPVSNYFEKKWLKKIKKESARHVWAVVLTLVCLVLVLAMLLTALIPSIWKSVAKLVANWDSYAEHANNFLLRISEFLDQHNIKISFFSEGTGENKINALTDKLFTLAKDNLDGILSKKETMNSILSKLGSIGSSISNFAIGVMFGFCFLVAKNSLLRLCRLVRSALFRKERIRRNNELFGHCHRVFIRYVGSTLLDALIIGVATLIFTLIMRMPYAPLIAAVVAITNIIPTFGPMIGAATGVFFLVLDKPINALIFYIFMCILQSLDGMVIKPRLFKGSLGIPGVWTLVLIIIGGKIAGVTGILLAIPAAAIFVIIYEETIVPRLRRRAAKINGELPPAGREETEGDAAETPAETEPPAETETAAGTEAAAGSE